MKLKDNKGLTLMEVILSIVLLGIVSALIMRIFGFTIDSYEFGVDHTENIANLRLTAYKITDQVRNVRNVNLTDTTGTTSLDQYIWLDGNRLKHTNEVTAVEKSLSDDLIVSTAYELSLENDTYLLSITLTGMDNKTLSTDVLLNNMTSGAASIINTSGSVIEFDFETPP